MNKLLCDESCNVVVYRGVKLENKQKSVEFIQSDTVSLADGPSLFTMCMKLICYHYKLLDTLVDFPDIVGKQMFEFMLKDNLFLFDSIPKKKVSMQDVSKLRLLSIFNEAYKDMFAFSLSLKSVTIKDGLHMFLNCFSCLSELDVSNQPIDSAVIGMFSNFLSLKKLVLQKVNLDDKKICELTLPYRMYKERSKVLETFDVAGNKNITKSSIAYIMVFTNLSLLNISATKIKPNEIKHFNVKYKWTISKEKKLSSFVANVGWVAPVIDNLVNSDNIFMKVVKTTKASRFYRSAIKSNPQQPNLLQKPLELVADYTDLILCRDNCEIYPEALQLPNKDKLSMKRHGENKTSLLSAPMKSNKRRYVEDDDGCNDDSLYRQYYMPSSEISSNKHLKLEHLF